MVRTEARSETTRSETARIEIEAPVSGQNFISDLRQINEAMRQFDGPTSQATVHTHTQQTHTTQTHHSAPGPQYIPHVPPTPPPQYVTANVPVLATSAKTQAILQEVREKLNLSSEAEALNMLVALGYRTLKPVLG